VVLEKTSCGTFGVRVIDRPGRVGLVACVLGACRPADGVVTAGHPSTASAASSGNAAAAQAGNASGLAAIDATLELITRNYVDPKGIVPRQMFLSALQSIQDEVEHILLLDPGSGPTVRLRVGKQERAFAIDALKSPRAVGSKLREVFRFLESRASDEQLDLQKLEVAACRGLLSSLDRHCALLSPEDSASLDGTSDVTAGVGVVLSLKNQALTILRAVPGSPAARSGLRRLDRIAGIDGESTLNMTLDDAVTRLRGRPGSRLTLKVSRTGDGGWEGERPFPLFREEVFVQSVTSRLLAPGIGYVRIEMLQASTEDELDTQLKGLKESGELTGLVLDLRDNSGGLLAQAVRVADRFLERGVIASVAGAAEPREEKRAVSAGTEPPYPLAILVNAVTASGAEIVAAALKQREATVIVGQQTFGMGSIQLVFPRIAGDSSVKLTVAEFFGPDGVSVQGRGLLPDVQLLPATIDPVEMRFAVSDSSRSERDRGPAFDDAAPASGGAALRLRYDRPLLERLKRLQRGSEAADEFELDFPIRFARDLVSDMRSSKRSSGDDSRQEFVDKIRALELASSTRLKQLGIDWSLPATGTQAVPKASDFEVSVRSDRPSNSARAGESMAIVVTVKNNSTLPIHQLRAVTSSDAGYLDRRELLFGRIDPGKAVTATAPLGQCTSDVDGLDTRGARGSATRRSCRIPMDTPSRQDTANIRFEAANGEPPPSGELRTSIEALPPPAFQWSHQLVDDREGNGDGLLEPTERATLYVTVKNVGPGRSPAAEANLRSLSGGAVLVRAGRFSLSSMNPGEAREVKFTVDLLKRPPKDVLELELSTLDRELHIVASEIIRLPVPQSGLAVESGSGFSTVATSTQVRKQPLPGADSAGALEQRSLVERRGQYGGFVKVGLGGSRFGFVPADSLLPATGRTARFRFTPSTASAAPRIEIAPLARDYRGPVARITGTAIDSDRVLAFSGNRKVFYQSGEAGSAPTRLPFEFDVSLNPGANVITLVARGRDTTSSPVRVVLRRYGPNGETLFGQDVAAALPRE
jgi:carboxyl-terminal processing protease